MRALGLQPLLEAGAVLERTHLELMDEVPESERSFPDFAAASSAAPPETPNDGTPAEDDRPRSSSPTALLANPLSFET